MLTIFTTLEEKLWGKSGIMVLQQVCRRVRSAVFVLTSSDRWGNSRKKLSSSSFEFVSPPRTIQGSVLGRRSDAAPWQRSSTWYCYEVINEPVNADGCYCTETFTKWYRWTLPLHTFLIESVTNLAMSHKRINIAWSISARHNGFSKATTFLTTSCPKLS